jgi:D-alanine--poly(phosphoribitol) ligase subunit 2
MTSISEQVLTTLAEVTHLDSVKTDLDMRLYETHVLDSIGTVELILALSEQFGLEVSPAELDREQWATPRKIVEYFESRVVQ